MRVCISLYLVFIYLLRCFTAVDVSESCYAECSSKVVSDEDDFDVACNDTCKVEKCRDGCDSWLEGISDTCQSACEEEEKMTRKSWNLYCVMGCNIAISKYITKLKDACGTPAAPYLVADTCTNDSVTIAWVSAPFSNITYLVQWRYEASNDWEYYESSNLLSVNELTLTNLHPYTNYRFRVAWILVKNITPLFSEESVAISTLPHGIPSTPPTLRCLTAAGSTRVSVTWEPPVFPNGPILSYVLYVRQHPTGFISIKDVSGTSGGFHYMFNDLKPGTTYIISITTRNSIGEGPADTKNITMPEKKLTSASHHPLPYMVIAANNKVLKQGIRILEEAATLYHTPNNSIAVTGVGLHIKKGLMFTSESNGNVHHMRFKNDFKSDTILKSKSHSPVILSVDWLNEKLYMAESDQISRADFSGADYEILLTNLISHPTTMHVDPFNGYLFYAARDSAIGGIYRVDLAEFETGPKTVEHVQHVVKDYNIVSFSVDFKNFRLLYPDEKRNTIISSALDGNDAVDIRVNSQTSQFTNVVSMAVFQNLFYWTDGMSVFGEEYHQEEDVFYHNIYLLTEGPFSNLHIHHPHCQPDPSPLNPVEAVQAVFSDTKVKIRWSKPRILGGLGKGAWQKWSYEVHLTYYNSSTYTSEKNIFKFKHVIDGLQPNTSYSIKVRACSSGGTGPWSSTFHGSTLKSNNFPANPFILWSTHEGLLKSDVVGEHVEALVSKMHLHNAHIKDISWFNGSIFLNANSSSVYVFNANGKHAHPLSRLTNVTNAASIAIDWFAPKIYWSSPVQQMISRADLDGSRAEPLPILTMAKELAIDSPNGFIYWATSHSIECSRLNGDDHFTYMKNELFSGKHIMGLSLDMDRGQLYWVLRSHEGSLLYRAFLVNLNFGTESTVKYEVMGPLPEDNVRGIMGYFDDRLFWLHEHKGALVTDVNGHNMANLQGFTNLETLTVVDPALHPYPDGLKRDTISVVPSSVVDTSIQVEGTWNNFTIIWDPVKSINYGSVFYQMKVDDGHEIYNLVTDKPIFSYPIMRHLLPYSSLTVAVKAYTYWASSRQTIVSLSSPMSNPSKPSFPRAFIIYDSSPLYDNDKNIQVIFRWQPPTLPNGIIINYQILLLNTNLKNVSYNKVDGETLEFCIHNLDPNTTYHFQVRAFTSVGPGPYSDIVQARTSEEYPIPKLIFTKNNAVKITDVDTHKQKLLTHKVTKPTSIAYLAHDGNVFWIEEDGALMSSSLDGTNTTLVRNIPAKVTSISVDWISREIYWTEVEKSNKFSSIWAMNMQQPNSAHLVLNHSDVITTLETEPFSSSLLWIVKKQTHSELMISNNKGLNIKPLFLKSTSYSPSLNSNAKSAKLHYSSTCNCTPVPVGNSIALDNRNVSSPKVIWTDSRFGHIWSSDLNGCRCYLMFNASNTKYNGLPPTSLTIDHSRVYWTNETLGKLFIMNRESENMFRKDVLPLENIKIPSSDTQKKRHISFEEIGGIKAIRAFGNYLQPFPDHHCLFPLPYKETARLISRSPTSLTLYFPPAERSTQCTKISMAMILHTVIYWINDDNNQNCFAHFKDNGCKTIETYNNTLVLYDLQPFLNYSIRVAASNYYSKQQLFFGPEIMYQTKEGTPSAPTNVTAQVITPFRIDVFWQPPIFPNGYPILYEVRWRTEYVLKSGQSAVYIRDSENTENSFMMRINTNEPGTKHFIIVRAYSSAGDMHNDSSEITVTTYDLPNNLTLIEETSHSISLLWESPGDNSISHHSLEYSEAGSFTWHLEAKNVPTKSSSIYELDIEGLNSKTKYNFRLLLTYKSKKVTIQWPEEHYFQFETNGDVPGLPGEPQVRNINKVVYQVYWDEAESNDGENLFYELQTRSKGETFENWQTVSNNTNTQWIMERVSVNKIYEFRVRSVNEYGTSNFTISKEFLLPEQGALVDSADDQVGLLMGSGLSLFFILLLSLCTIYWVYRRREKYKKMLHVNVTPDQLSPELELATLQDLPRNGNFVHQTNALYNLDIPADEQLLELPQIRREQIILTKFLGSGAFGEVFEGIAHDLAEGSLPMKVAIKTLRKGATDHEKEEFLKEAKLMSNFKHDHILQLLGVCFNNNPNFIILELMEGGDLLSFLRNNRPSVFQRSTLTMDDLLAICVDVALGCKYLEDMHFVHRDLAARNCLVSSLDREHRVVKIGDFGLARDIYKHDYYRKVGEGLLPVRWMAPESLIYGIFTSQSDIWAFGVLLWEVITIGQQPYPARSNLEVFHYVCAGGRLDKPENCPDDLHEVMVNCWGYNPDSRPTFSYCLRALQELQQKSIFSPSLLPIDQNQNCTRNSINGGYIIGIGELSNQKHDLEQEDDNLSTRSDPIRSDVTYKPEQLNLLKRSASLDHDIQSTETSVCTANMPLFYKRNGFISSGNRNKYLELLADNEDADGYEIPLRSHMHQKNIPSCHNHVFLNGQFHKFRNKVNKPVLKPFLVPSYAQVFSSIGKTNNSSDAFAHDVSSQSNIVNYMEQSRSTNEIPSSSTCSHDTEMHCLSEKMSCKEQDCCVNDAFCDEPSSSISADKDNNRSIDNVSDVNLFDESDRWSISTASTAPCDLNSTCSSRNSGIYSSAAADVNLNYIPTTSWC